MLEIPESHVLAGQANGLLTGKCVRWAVANQSPHGFAWYAGDPALYGAMLEGKCVGQARAYGGLLEIDIGDMQLTFGDGASPRLYEDAGKAPARHQLRIDFTDGSALVATVQMYGGIWVIPQGGNDNPYYLTAKEHEAVSPLRDAFDRAHFDGLIGEKERRLSAKAFLATEQRIPGLGNGVLQDILWTARIHPKRKLETLAPNELDALFAAVKDVLGEMTRLGGRDVQKDLLGKPGGYHGVLTSKALALPCPRCGGMKHRAAYLGGNIYYCENCQRV